jgi:hypothetical protein
MNSAAASLPAVKARSDAATRQWLMPLLVGAAVLAVGMALVDGLPVGVTNDDGMYVILAKSLATGHGYRWLNLPGAPAATHFPPGYPAILAVLWWIAPAFPANVIVFKLANAMFMAVAATATFALARTRLELGEPAAAALTFAGTLGIPVLTLSTIVMSEALFLALLIPTLLLAERVLSAEERSGRDVLVLALLAGAATLVRTHGVALIAAVVLALALRRRIRDALVFAGATLALVAPWQLWVSIHSSAVPLAMRGNYESYGAWFATGLHANGLGLIGRTVGRTTTELAGMLATVVAPSMPVAVRLLALAVVLAALCVGLRELWRRAPVVTFFLGFYLAIVVIWPFSPTRFVWGVWPLVIALLGLAARRALAWRPTTPTARLARFAAVAASALVASGYVAYNVRGYRHQWWSSIPRAVSRNASPLVAWVGTHVPPDAVVATEVESAVYLYTGRRAVPVSTFTVDEYFAPRTPAENAAAIREIVARYRPTAVIVSSGRMRDAVRVLATSTPATLAVADTFSAGGLVLIPNTR